MFNALELSFYLLDNIVEGVILLNPDLHVVYINKHVEKYTGMHHHDLMGKPLSEILGGKLSGETGIMEQAMNTQKIVHHEMMIASKPYTLSAYSFKGLNDEADHKIITLYPVPLNSDPIEAGAETILLDKDDASPFSFGNQLVEDIEDLAEAKNIKVTLSVSEYMEDLFIDEKQMAYSVMSFLSRAINFSDQGRIVVRIEERDTGYSDIIRIENPEEKIKDSDLKALENSFSKGTDKAKNIVEAHGGRLWLETDDEGFAIVFSIPKNLL
jgi:signal transduction histidine kinase